MFFKFRTDFHFSHEVSLGEVSRWASNKVWLSKVPRLSSSGTKLLLKYQRNFVSISLERTMQCSCKSVPAYSGSFCSQIDKIWGSLRIFSIKKTKQRICQIDENKQSVETLLLSNFSHQLRLAYILQGKSFHRLGVSHRRRTISIISYHTNWIVDHWNGHYYGFGRLGAIAHTAGWICNETLNRIPEHKVMSGEGAKSRLAHA